MPEAQDGARPADEDRVMLMEYWYRLYDAKLRRYTVNAAVLAGGVLLEEHRDVYRHGMYPFVLDVYTPIEGLPVGDGLVQEFAPMMRYINRYASYIDMNLRMASKGRLLVDRAAGLDKEALMDWETDVIEGDRIDAGAIQWLQTQPFTGLAAQQMLQLQTDIKQDSGQTQFTRGETAGGVTAASAISALQEAGGKMTRLRTNVFNQGFKAMVEQTVWLISQFYSPRRILCVTGRDAGLREIDADPIRLFGRGRGAAPPPPYTVQVQVQRRNPLRQQAQNELFLQAYRMSAEAGQVFPLSALFELLHVDGKERILPLLKQYDEAQKRLDQLTEENDQVQARNSEIEQEMAGLQKLLDEIGEEEE